MWIGIIKLSLLRPGYFSSAANLLRSCPKNWHTNKRDFFQLNLFGSDQWIWLKSCDAHFNSAWARLACCFSKGPLKVDFLDVYLTTFSESVIFEIHNLSGQFFCSKRSKFQLEFKNEAKNREKVFYFSDNCIWIGIVKLSVLRTGYFSSIANLLTSSPKTWHVKERNFFEYNFFASDHWIW